MLQISQFGAVIYLVKMNFFNIFVVGDGKYSDNGNFEVDVYCWIYGVLEGFGGTGIDKSCGSREV